jgi:GNAT superfamily N-acetyltransferase
MSTDTPEGLQDHIHALGLMALGSRLRRLSDTMMGAVSALYADAAVGFEPRWFPLYRLLEAHGPLPVSEAAARLRVTHAAVSTLARQMRHRGLVQAEKDPTDERRTLLSLTDAGRALGDGLAALWADLEQAITGLLGEGPDLMAAVSGVEAALARRALVDRVRDATAARGEAVQIVEFTPALAPDFERLNLAWISRYFTVEPKDRATLEQPQRTVIDPGGQILFAQVGGATVGTCALIVVAPGVFEVAKMAVDEAWQGRGLGRRLMEAALAWAAAAGAHTVELETNSALRPAVALYRKMGFEDAPLADSPYRRCDVRMVKRLALG